MYKQGYDAFCNDDVNCPYQLYTLEYIEWHCGWNAAKKDYNFIKSYFKII